MENKMHSYSKLRYLAAVLLFCLNAGFAQKIDRYYVSNLQEKGILYFVLPQNVFETKATKLNYDITYFNKSDSALFNFSVNSSQAALLKNVQIKSATSTLQLPIKKLYVEATKNGWTARYTAKIAYADLQTLFNQEKAPVFEITNNGGNTLISCKQKQWRKISRINQRIFQVINFNV